MTDITPKYFDHPDYCTRFLEWQAIKAIVFKGKHGSITITLMHIARDGGIGMTTT